MGLLPDVSLAVLERVFPRSLAALDAAGERDFARTLARHKDLALVPHALADRKWEAGRGFLPDLAALEHALRLAALAPEIESRGFERVMQATEPDWYAARLRFDPGHRIVESDWPLHEAFEKPRELHRRAPATFLVFRTGGRAEFRRLGANEEALLRPLRLGVPLGRVLERRLGPDFDAPVLHRWIESGLLRAIDWASA